MAKKKKGSGDEEDDENKDRKPGARRQGYIHKPFLYSRYYSDSDDEDTVEQRRRSAVCVKSLPSFAVLTEQIDPLWLILSQSPTSDVMFLSIGQGQRRAPAETTTES